jgi:hypothetical protein
MRDFNPYRVQRALVLFGGTGREVMSECGNVVKVVKEPSVYRGGASGSGMILRQGCHISRRSPHMNEDDPGYVS